VERVDDAPKWFSKSGSSRFSPITVSSKKMEGEKRGPSVRRDKKTRDSSRLERERKRERERRKRRKREQVLIVVPISYRRRQR